MQCIVVSKSIAGRLLKAPTGEYFLSTPAEETIKLSKKDVLKFLRGEL